METYVDWSIEREKLVTVATGRIEVTELMTVDDIENSLRSFVAANADPLVVYALQELECQKKLAEDLARRQGSPSILGIRMQRLWTRLCHFVGVSAQRQD